MKGHRTQNSRGAEDAVPEKTGRVCGGLQILRHLNVEPMIKKKASKTETKKTTRKQTGKKKHVDPARVREEIASLVKCSARDIAEAVMDLAKHGELAPAKFLLEMAGVYPPSTDGSQATQDEECLAKTLLDRLNIPDKPVVHDQQNAEDEGDSEEMGEAEEGKGEEESPVER